MKKVDVAIIGAGTAGLSAYSEVKKVTENFVIINSGPYGTTCARIGCMPSKVLIQIANDFYRRKFYRQSGIYGAGDLKISIPDIMKTVRGLRDHFVKGVLKTIEKIGKKNIQGFARFIAPGILEVDGKEKITAKRIIIAAGSEPILPKSWEKFGNEVITTDEFFEQTDLPNYMGIIGAGVIGLELGQALSRLGIRITAVNGIDFIGGLSDPVVNDYAVNLFKNEFDLVVNEMANIEKNTKLEINYSNGKIGVDKVVASMGRKPLVSELGLENAGIKLNEQGQPDYDPLTMQISNLPVYIAGDVNGDRPVLHEAVDEGHIAGYNAVHKDPVSFKRRTGLTITFTDPNIATAGKRFSDLNENEIIIGQASFEPQARSVITSENKGILRIYGDPRDGKILGSEMIAPAGEHLAHQVAWCIQMGLTVFDMLALPYYHPVIEEGLQTALLNLAGKVRGKKPDSDLITCKENPVDCLK